MPPSTRQSARLSASVRASPAPGPATPSIPKATSRGRPSKAVALPNVGVAPSSAYGTGIASQPNQLVGQGSSDVTEVLNELMQGERAAAQRAAQRAARGRKSPASASTRGGKAASKTPSRVGRAPKSRTPMMSGGLGDVSIQEEASIVDGAGLEPETPSIDQDQYPAHEPIIEEEEEDEDEEEEQNLRQQESDEQQRAAQQKRDQERDERDLTAKRKFARQQRKNSEREHKEREEKECREQRPQFSLSQQQFAQEDDSEPEEENPRRPTVNWELIKNWKDVLVSWLKPTSSFAIVFMLGCTVISMLLSWVGSESVFPFRFYGPTDLKHNIGQFIPEFIVHPVVYWHQGEMDLIFRQVQKLEYDMHYYLRQTTLLDDEIQLLKNLNVLKLEKDKDGNPVIPVDVYYTLRDRLRQDSTLFPTHQIEAGDGHTSGGTLSIDEFNRLFRESGVRQQMEKAVKDTVSSTFSQEHEIQRKLSDNTLRRSTANAEGKLGDYLRDIATKNDEFLQKEHVENKKHLDEAVRQIRLDWAESKREIEPKIARLYTQMEQTLHRMGVLENGRNGMSKQEVESLFQKLIIKAKLEGLSNVKINAYTRSSDSRINYFSPGHGAVINPYHTSPDWVFPSMKALVSTKAYWWLRNQPLPAPNPPVTALTKWDEHGECWCTPAGGRHGYGASLNVIMGHTIYPDQIVVEHIASTAAIQPGSAPREMEVMALIESEQALSVAEEASFKKFQETEEEFSYGYVRIAQFTYLPSTEEEVQAFPVQINLRTHGNRGTKQLIIRAKNNWGGGKVDYTCLYRIRVHGSPA